MRVLAIDGAEKNVECLRKTFEGKDNIIVEHQILLDDIKVFIYMMTMGHMEVPIRVMMVMLNLIP